MEKLKTGAELLKNVVKSKEKGIKLLDASEKFYITKQQDTDYLSAVEKGDTKKAEKMVKEAAKVRRFYLNFSKNSSIVMTLNIGKGVWASTSK